MSSILQQSKDSLTQLGVFLESTPWNKEYGGYVKNLILELDKPCELAVAGRVKAGKSSFINALLGADLAKTGITETTATINYFKYGIPEDPGKPIRCVYSNGRETWVSREFLDSLQDHSKEALAKAEGIKHLEFFVSDPRLEKVTLVDTPGFDAIVGEDGSGHEKVSDQYLLKKLRDRHTKETELISSAADAVIYLVGQVANLSSQTFLQEFKKTSGGNSSAMNAIGVLAKVDISDEIINQRFELAESIAQKLQGELNAVVPVSAGIWRAWDELKKQDDIIDLQQKLRTIPEKRFFHMLKSETAYLRRMLTGCPLSVEERRQMKGKMPWRVFVLIARQLYSQDINRAEQYLKDISGMEKISGLLETHFFQRGRVLRCNRIVNDTLTLLSEIKRAKLHDLNEKARCKNDFIEFVQSHPLQNEKQHRVAKQLTKFVEEELVSEKEADIIAEGLDSQISIVENLLLGLRQTNNNFAALKIIEEAPEEFTNEEIKDLRQLFCHYGSGNIEFDPASIAHWQMYWKKEYNWARGVARKQVAQMAIEKFGSL